MCPTRSLCQIRVHEPGTVSPVMFVSCGIMCSSREDHELSGEGLQPAVQQGVSGVGPAQDAEDEGEEAARYGVSDESMVYVSVAVKTYSPAVPRRNLIILK